MIAKNRNKVLLLFCYKGDFMKKIIIFSILASLFLVEYSPALAAQINKSVKSNVIYETSLIKIVKEGNKYGVFDKKNNKYFVKPVLDNISTFSKNNDFEYKIKSGDMLGYMNFITGDSFISNFDDIAILNSKYLKIKKGENYGLTDKKGKVIVPASYQKVAVTQYNDTEYLIGKSANRYDVFFSDGSPVRNNDMETLDKSTFGASIVRDLQPVLKKYRETIKKIAENPSETIVVKNDDSNITVVSEKDDVIVNTEIGKLPIPTMQKIFREEQQQIKKSNQTSIISSNYEEEIQPEVDVEELPVPSVVKKLSVKHEDYAQNFNKTKNVNDAVDVLTVNNKTYYVTNKDGKLGLQTKHGKDIIPAVYNALNIKTIGKEKNPDEIIAALDDRNTKLYDINGSILAKRFHNKINVYTSMRKYEYVKDENGIYTISFNDRKVGEIELFKDGTYEYKRTGFNMSNMNKANELFITLLKSEL